MNGLFLIPQLLNGDATGEHGGNSTEEQEVAAGWPQLYHSWYLLLTYPHTQKCHIHDPQPRLPTNLFMTELF